MSASQPEVLRGRHDECEALDDLLRGARAGRSAALVLCGDPGIGKTALLDHLAGRSSGCRVLRVSGVESEMELAYAGLHQLCSPLLGRLDALPAPQAEALGTSFGLRQGSPPDRLLIGLAVLTLLSDSATEQPLVCLVDDAQWLDRASLQSLTFVARRLAAESVVMVFAVRTGEDDRTWAGLPQLTMRGLSKSDAEAVLDSAITSPLDRRVRGRMLAEIRGNPLALLELPRLYSATELSFGPDPVGVTPLASRIQDGFRRQLEPLPHETRRLLLAAAAEPLGDVSLLARAAEQLGIRMEAAAAAEATGLMELRDTVRFRHPLVRSVAYWSEPLPERQAVHLALAEATDPERDPDRRAWHRAHATAGADEDVAAELERCADRAIGQGGVAAAAAFLERAGALTPDPGERARRQLGAAQAMVHAGSFDAALNLLALAELGPLTDLQRARVDVLRAQVGFASNRGTEALPLLLAAAHTLEPLDIELALDTYVDALTAAVFAGRLASGTSALEVAQAAKRAPAPAHPRPGDVLVQGVAVLNVDGYSAAVPLLQQAAREFEAKDLSLEEAVRFLWLAVIGAILLWDHNAWGRLVDRHLRAVRASGALSALPLALDTHVYADLFAGDLDAASTLVDEARALLEVVESQDVTPYGAIALAAFRGHEEEAAPLFEAAMNDVVARGEGVGVSMVSWARALMFNGLGRYDEALESARVAVRYPAEVGGSSWAMVELIEAAVRCGEPAAAADAFAQLRDQADACGTEWALGLVARSAALLSETGSPDDLYREAIDRLGGAGLRVEVARTRLLHGEWLLSAGQRDAAREQLREAHDSFAAMGMDAFYERARLQLAAAGETISKRVVSSRQELTTQELHIARLAAEGRTNPEIGAELFISPHTVEWHLRKVFTKLGIRSRRQIRAVLSEGDGPSLRDGVTQTGRVRS